MTLLTDLGQLVRSAVLVGEDAVEVVGGAVPRFSSETAQRSGGGWSLRFIETSSRTASRPIRPASAIAVSSSSAERLSNALPR